MTARIIDCKIIADEIKQDVKQNVGELRQQGITPHLTAVQIGHCPASKIYTSRQQKLSQKFGIEFTLCEMPENTTQDELFHKIDELNNNANVSGIILQMPLPEHIQASQVQVKIDPRKDVEGVNPVNLGHVVLNDFEIAPCTAYAVMKILEHEKIELKGKNVVVVGHSNIVGKPLALMLLGKFATTTVCHIETIDLKSHTLNADILISATGKAGLIRGSMISPDSVLIDVGICRIPILDNEGKAVLKEDGCVKTKIVGDIDFESVRDIASAITPVPGGVGAVTSAILMENIIKALKIQL